MKILKTILAVALLSLSATTVSAQEVEYQFQPHMYLDLQGGAQYTLGEAKFKDLISPNVQIGLGYQFSPVIGLRLQANAWQSKGAGALTAQLSVLLYSQLITSTSMLLLVSTCHSTCRTLFADGTPSAYSTSALS